MKFSWKGDAIASPIGGNEMTAEAIDEAANNYIRPQPKVEANSFPAGIAVGASHAELLYKERAAAQPDLFNADAEKLSRPWAVRAVRAGDEADAAKQVISDAVDDLKAASENKRDADKTLRPLARRGKFDTPIYYGSLALMLVGDGTGVSQPLINYGEVPELAIAQSLSAAAAMVVSGLAGRRCKDYVNARARETAPKDLQEDLKKYSHRFRDPGRASVFALGFSALVATTIPTGVGLLRYAVDDTLFGIVFALIAVGVCIASGIASFWHADDIADLLADYAKERKQARKALRKLAKDKAIKEQAGATITVASIKAEYTHRGAAAGHELKALPHLIHLNNGHVYGHGLSPAQMAATQEEPGLFSVEDVAKLNGHKQANGYTGTQVKP